MKQLKNDYERRLKTVQTKLIHNNYDEDTKLRLEVKASCYRTFIAELNRKIVAENKVV